MGKKNITKEEKKEFRSTKNGSNKFRWMLTGIIIDIIATLGISLLIIFSERIESQMLFYILLFMLLVIIVLGGELIGVYFGAIEQYFYDKHMKKVLENNE